MAIGTIRILNKSKDKYTIDDMYIGRGSILGNPYTHLPLGMTEAEVKVNTREEAIAKYREYAVYMIKHDTQFRIEMIKLVERVLNGETVNLVCFCKPQACHGDVIKDIVMHEIKRVLKTKSLEGIINERYRTQDNSIQEETQSGL
jgi:hypothetical protein